MLALAVGNVVPRYWQDASVDLSHDEWLRVLSVFESMLSSAMTSRAPNSALMRAMSALALQRNSEKKKCQREDEFNLMRRYFERNKELLGDLKGWTRRALNHNTVLRVTGL
jgi:hypothetical protein